MQSQIPTSQTIGATEAGREDALKHLAAGSTGEALAGAGAVVLSILALSHVLPFQLTTIATICAGAALFLEGTAIAAQFNELEREINRTTKTHVALGGGMAFEVLGGLAGAVLGILALIGVVPAVLVPAAAITMGATLLLSTGATERLDKIRTHYYASQEPAVHWTHESVLGASGLQVLAGLAGITLGILSLIGFMPMVLTETAMLCIGGSVFLAGIAITGKMAAVLHH